MTHKTVDRRRVTEKGIVRQDVREDGRTWMKHDDIHKPLMAASRYFREHLRRDIADGTLTPEMFWAPVLGLLIASEQSYAAVCTLVSDKRAKTLPLQAAILVRSMFEGLGNLLAFADDPVARAEQYGRDWYKTAALLHEHLVARHAQEEKWKEYLRRSEASLEGQANLLRLTAQERQNPRSLVDWPTPGRLLSLGYIRGPAAAFFRSVRDSEYSIASALAHQRLAALGRAYISDEPDLQWTPGLMDSNAALEAAFYFLCVLSEVEHLLGRGAVDHVRVAWERLRAAHDLFTEALTYRYRDLLNLAL